MDFLNFYRYTESFYTELAYKTSKNENNKILENNLIKLEKIKTEGRKFLNLFFNGKESYFTKTTDCIDNKDNFLNSTVEELKIGKIIKEEEINERNNNHLLTIDDIYDEQTSNFNEIKKWKQSLLNKTNILKGTAASKGVIRLSCSDYK